MKPAHELAGSSLKARLDDPHSPGKAAVFFDLERARNGTKALGRGVRTEKWRYSEWDGGKAGRELYIFRHHAP